MNIIVGLGNPGQEYQQSRHNLGFMVLDQLAKSWQLKFSTFPKAEAEVCRLDQDTLLCKPQTYMNHAGQAVRQLLDFYKLWSSSAADRQLQPQVPQLLVVHDDLDLALGMVKLQFGIGPKAHNGLLSIYEHLGTKQFWHLRGGVDNRGEQRSTIVPSEYVLQSFMAAEQHLLQTELAMMAKQLDQFLSIPEQI
ncbi:MAG: aminoacyl-tRNA hydrolase [Candidatus Pacebacteria bacterium CG_4_10_14_0_8_um_filter_43_12]|nr:MAG: aminoacyl-tRNA hydrolase [Candidatus Pacebacteria bacterium CG10_big_fil_rev_8_21_14_0_10_44_11]PIY79604.1 MAG: aminoacyl-tRNA hydrolase [Candidatus Pacebacteria bacterium CG_4_10_14_0_8_um_filter_43_12]